MGGLSGAFVPLELVVLLAAGTGGLIGYVLAQRGRATERDELIRRLQAPTPELLAQRDLVDARRPRLYQTPEPTPEALPWTNHPDLAGKRVDEGVHPELGNVMWITESLEDGEETTPVPQAEFLARYGERRGVFT